MENIIFSANVVFPLLILMSLGYFTRQKGLLDPKTVLQCNALVFQLFLPVLIFYNVKSSSLSELGSIKLFVFVFAFILVAFIITTIFVVLLEKENPKRGVMIQGIVRSNYALFGIPLVTLLFPDGNIAIASLLIAIVIPVYNVSSVIVLTYFGNKNANIKTILLAVLKNPLIIATFFGIIALFTQVSFPAFLDQSIEDVASIASPFALFLLGASFEFKTIRNQIRQLSISLLGRLVIIPTLAITLAILLGFRNEELGCILVIFSSPTAVSSFTMAQTMGGDGDLAASIVVFTYLMCLYNFYCDFPFKDAWFPLRHA